MSSQLVTAQLVTTTWLNEVERRKPTGAAVATPQTTTSVAYVDLATIGPAVTVTTGTSALVFLKAAIVMSTADEGLMGFAISGATTRVAADGDAISVQGTSKKRLGAVFLVTGLTPGSNTFTAKYRVTAGTGTFHDRSITVVPFD